MPPDAAMSPSTTSSLLLVSSPLPKHKPEGHHLWFLQGQAPVKEAGEVHMHHIAVGHVDEDVLPMPVAQA